MKMFLISDNTDTLLGMRFAGVEGVVVHDRETVVKTITEIAADKNCGIVLITSKLKKLCDDFLSDFMERNPMPLFIEIPDRHGGSREGGSILEFIEHSIGLKLGGNATGKSDTEKSSEDSEADL